LELTCFSLTATYKMLGNWELKGVNSEMVLGPFANNQLKLFKRNLISSANGKLVIFSSFNCMACGNDFKKTDSAVQKAIWENIYCNIKINFVSGFLLRECWKDDKSFLGGVRDGNLIGRYCKENVEIVQVWRGW
jgi:hypothetical protein